MKLTVTDPRDADVAYLYLFRRSGTPVGPDEKAAIAECGCPPICVKLPPMKITPLSSRSAYTALFAPGFQVVAAPVPKSSECRDGLVSDFARDRHDVDTGL